MDRLRSCLKRKRRSEEAEGRPKKRARFPADEEDLFDVRVFILNPEEKEMKKEASNQNDHNFVRLRTNHQIEVESHPRLHNHNAELDQIDEEPNAEQNTSIPSEISPVLSDNNIGIAFSELEEQGEEEEDDTSHSHQQNDQNLSSPNAPAKAETQKKNNEVTRELLEEGEVVTDEEGERNCEFVRKPKEEVEADVIVLDSDEEEAAKNEDRKGETFASAIQPKPIKQCDREKKGKSRMQTGAGKEAKCTNVPPKIAAQPNKSLLPKQKILTAEKLAKKVVADCARQVKQTTEQKQATVSSALSLPEIRKEIAKKSTGGVTTESVLKKNSYISPINKAPSYISPINKAPTSTKIVEQKQNIALFAGRSSTSAHQIPSAQPQKQIYCGSCKKLFPLHQQYKLHLTTPQHLTAVQNLQSNSYSAAAAAAVRPQTYTTIARTAPPSTNNQFAAPATPRLSFTTISVDAQRSTKAKFHCASCGLHFELENQYKLHLASLQHRNASVETAEHSFSSAPAASNFEEERRRKRHTEKEKSLREPKKEEAEGEGK